MLGGRLPSFFTPDKMIVSREAFKELKASGDPWQIKVFEDDRTRVELRHVEKAYGLRDIPKEHWKLYEVIVQNKITTDAATGAPLSEPKYVPDPDGTKQYRTLGEASGFYETFLASYTDSTFDIETGKLVEVGNLLAPPDPDVPVIAPTSPLAEEFGSW